jgi:hypothetical protein
MDKMNWPINRLIKESSLGECKICGSTANKKYWLFGQVRCINPQCPTNKEKEKIMKCQKGKACRKQPSNAPRLPANTKYCTGCDKIGKDKKSK